MHKHALLHVKKPAELKGKIHTPKGKTNKKKKNSGGQAGWVLGGKEREKMRHGAFEQRMTSVRAII